MHEEQKKKNETKQPFWNCGTLLILSLGEKIGLGIYLFEM